MEVRTLANELPLRSVVTLQTIIREWDRARQTQALRAKRVELEMLRLQIAPQLVTIIDEYRQTLETYLKNLDQNGFILSFRRKAGLRRLTNGTVNQLNALDARREALRPKQKPITAASAAP